VRIEKVARAEASEPRFAAVAQPGRLREPPQELRYGEEWAQ
jgi:hypothetical protein